MLAICTWLWGDKYDLSDLAKLARGVRRHLTQPHRFLVMTERERSTLLADDLDTYVERHAIKKPELTAFRGCFARLQLFDTGWQKNRGLNDRIVNLDLDTVITGPLDPLFDRDEDFVILQGANASNPCPYTGAVFMFKAGTHGDLWTDFWQEWESTGRVPDMPIHEFADDQGWFAKKIPNAAGWKVGESGIYAFQKPGWPAGTKLPSDARIVTFIGWRKPSKFASLPWVIEHWRAENSDGQR